MAVFTYSEETIQRLVHNMVRLRRWIRSFAAVWLAVDLAVALVPLAWNEFRIHSPETWSIAVFTIPFVLFFNTFNGRNRLPERMAEHLRAYSVEVSPFGVSVQSHLGPQRQFARDEILRVEESPLVGGLYLRSPNRYRWLLLPSRLDGFGKLREELRAMGIPFTRKVIPTNGEEFGFVLLFCATLICNLVTRSREILTVNMIVAILIGIGGFLIIDANPENSRRMWRARLGAFLPAILCALAFFLLHR